MNYNQAINYCFKRISRFTIPTKTDLARLQSTKWKHLNGKAGIESIYSMFNYFGIQDKSTFSIKGKEVSKAKAQKWCFDQVKGNILTFNDYNRWTIAKRRWKKGELEVQSTFKLFEFFGVKRIDNFVEPASEVIKIPKPEKKKVKIQPEDIKRFSYEDKNGIKYYRFLTHLCKDQGLNYQMIRFEISGLNSLTYNDCEIKRLNKLVL